MFRKYVRGGLRIPEDGFTPKFNVPPLDGLRPCLADEKPALFHRWTEQRVERVDLSSASLESSRQVFALVEYSDGSVGQVKPELVQFLDRGDDCMG